MTELADVPRSTAAPVESVPFYDLEPSHRGLKTDLLADFAQLIETNAYTNGPPVAAFEAAFAAYCRSAACVGVASGLDALRLALIASGVGPGDEVIVPAATFVATLEAVTQAGGVPRVVDVSNTDYGIDARAVDAAIGPRTRCIVPVHLYGQMADIAELVRVAERHDVVLVEDACQAHGAARDGIRPGARSSAAAFSFYPGKNLGAMGDAGAVVSNDDVIVRTMRVLREHGQHAKYQHDVEGWTARLDTLQAMVLLRKLSLLESWNAQRAAAAAFYSEALDGVGDLALPTVASGSTPVWHLYVVRTQNPLALGEHLRERGIGTGRHYPQPVHLTGAYRKLGYAPGAFPVAERLADEAISMPLFPGITTAQLEYVVDAVVDYFGHG